MHFNNRIQLFQLDARIIGCEAPVDLDLSLIASLLPGSDLTLHCLQIGQSAVQTLSSENGECALSDVEPTGVFGCVVPFQFLCNAPGFGTAAGNDGQLKISRLLEKDPNAATIQAFVIPNMS